MSLTVSSKGGGMEPAPEGQHLAICVGMYDVGTHYNKMYGKTNRKVVITWELPELRIQGGVYDGEPRQISKTYTASLNDKAVLRKDLESWRGRAFREEELEAFDLKNILGQPCLLGIIHKTKEGGGIVAKVNAVTQLPKFVQAPPAFSQPKFLDLDDNNWRWELDNGSLPEWIVRLAKESLTYQEAELQEEKAAAAALTERAVEPALLARPGDDAPF